jgi:hypothetical protein
MLTVKGFHRTPNGTQFDIDSDEYMGGGQNIMYLLVDGVLETYMEPYDLPADVCLSALLIDAFYDDVTAPFSDDEGAAEKFAAIGKMANKRISWKCDKKALISAVRVDEGEPGPVAARAIATKIRHAENAQGHRRLREERLADDYVASLPKRQREIPRMDKRPVAEGSVGLAIEFVP